MLLSNQMSSLRESGFEVVGISSPSSREELRDIEGTRHVAIPISRNLTPFADLVSLGRLWRVMRRERFTIVHTHTPKAGLLGQLAARLAGVPVIVNTVHGFYFHDNMPARSRRFYIWMETLAALCSDRILSQNAEDVETAIRERICSREKITLLGNGIDLSRFDPESISRSEVEKLRARYDIPAGVPVVGFVGRLAAKRKGFADFLSAAREIRKTLPDCRFLILGPVDRGKADAIEPSAAADYGIADRCVFAGLVPNEQLPAFYRLMNVLVLPSLFEGVPRAVMEAAAMGVPAVVTDVKGNREAVEANVTGLLVRLNDVPALTAAILRILTDRELAARMSSEARRLAAERFDERRVFARVKSEYARLLAQKELPTGATCSQTT